MTRLYACKLEVYIPGSSTAVATNLPQLTRPYLTAPDNSALEATSTVRASDVGYRDLSDGIFPPLLDTAFEFDRALALAPGADAVGASWGNMVLLNPGGTWDGVASTRSCDGRPISIYTGKKTYNTARGIWLDPAFSALTPVFKGLAKGWFLSENALQVPLTDATYFLEKHLQTSFYTGAGGYNGDTAMAGQPLPKARGGTNSNPIANISPVLIDSTNLIYQYNDAAGTVVNLYEGGVITYTLDTTAPITTGDTTDLYANPPAAGKYRTDNSRGLIRLGTAPVKPITADVTGAFATAGAKYKAADIALEMLKEDVGVPVGYIDTASFSSLATTYGWTTGYYFAGQEIDATVAVGIFLRSINAKLVSTRTGLISAKALRATTLTSSPAAAWGTESIVNVTPMRMSAPLDPPADLWRLGWNRNHTVLNASEWTGSISAARRAFVDHEWRTSNYFSADINAAYRKPSRPDIIETALLISSEADGLSTAVGELWGVRRRLYAVEVPIDIGLPRDIGDVIRISYPMDDLKSGKLGIIVGEQYRSIDATMTYQVLV